MVELLNHVVSEDQEHRQSVFQNSSGFYVQKRHKSGDELCLSVCQVQKIMTDKHTTHTHTYTCSHTRTAHISDNQSTKQINGQKKTTFKCSEGERLVPLEFGALVCEI